MDAEGRDKISAQSFSRTFEKMCNFIAVSKTGDPRATVRGLITLCLLELKDDIFNDKDDFFSAIETLFGLVIPKDQIESALIELERTRIILRLGNTNYRLSPNALESIKKAVDDAQALENRVKDGWVEQLKLTYPNIPEIDALKVLHNYLCITFRRHGIQTAALIDPGVDSPSEYEESLSKILHDVVADNKDLPKHLHKDMIRAVGDFMASLGSDADRSKYIAQIADGAFNFYTLEVPDDLSQQLRQQLHDLTLFLDTNFLFGILDLHYNTQVQVSHDLLNAISKHHLPFKLRFHIDTGKEMANTIAHYGAILRSRTWTRSLSRAASVSRNLSGIEQKFHEENSTNSIDVDEFLRHFEHFDHLLQEMNIKPFRPHEERMEARSTLFHDYQDFLRAHGRTEKPYEIIMHDATLLEEARNLRTLAPSSLEAGALVVSCDYFLYRFDWESARRNGHRACVLLPNILWQILRPFVPSDQDSDKAFAETFALPQFRAIGSGGSKACSKMLQILATYKDVHEETAMKMLANDLLLDQLKTTKNDAQFAEQVEVAFVEENSNLMEEKAALEREMLSQRALLEEERQKRFEENAMHAEKHKKMSKELGSVEQELERTKRTLVEHGNAASEANQRAERADAATKEAQDAATKEALEKQAAEQHAFKMSILSGFSSGILGVILFMAFTHLQPWIWLINHDNSIPIQIAISLMILFAFLGAMVKPWRKWCFGVGVFSLFCGVLLKLI
ncbi:hypothetical protein [Geothrix campi]|uniref:hypothetical protein n=1 Tax=Geothrix campi TaxID=2966450 RepID=UPI00214865AC|nr:hypothetical protein [Geothrix sp. SG10]